MDGKKLQTPKLGNLTRLKCFNDLNLIDILLGKRATFCEVSMGSRKQCTQISESLDPKWDASMQFLVKNIQDDILCVTVFNKDQYSPDGNLLNIYNVLFIYNSRIFVFIICDIGIIFLLSEFLGRSEIRVSEIIQSIKNSRGPLTKLLQLREVQTGVITLKLDLCFFDKN